MAHPRRFGAWLMAGLLGSCAFWAMGQDESAEARMQAQTRQIQDGFQKLGKQLHQIHQSRSQSDQALVRQGQSIQKQIEAVEQGQVSLGAQLSQLQTESQLQIERLQNTNRQLSWALWCMAGLAILMLWMLWRQRVTRSVLRELPPPSLPVKGVTSTVRVPTAASAPEAASPLPQQKQEVANPLAPAVADSSSQVPAAVPPFEAPAPEPAASAVTPPSPSAPATPAWAALVAADLSSTQQALAQARQGFMQPVRTEK